jgi:multiple sugar transport system ATP-binding protein
MLGIEDLLGRRPRELSGGQRQRVALGRAIVREPKVFLMDEPLSNLDAKLRVQTRAELIRLHRRLGITTIYVTHDQTEAMTMGDRIAVLRDGVLQQVASPDELYKKPANTFVASFIGSPPMNLLTLPVERGNASLGGASIPVPINSGKIVLGIRPEEFRTSAEGIELRPTVDVVEPLGATKSVMLTIDGNSLTASLDADVQVEEGKSISLWIRPNSIHYFDADSGNAIRQTSGDEAMTVSSQGSQ